MKWFLTGRIQRVFHGFINSQTFDSNLEQFLQFVCDSVWPNNVFVTPAPPVTDADRSEAKAKAEEMIARYISKELPFAVSSVAGGREHLLECVLTLHRFLQHDILTKHLVFGMMDTFVRELFPMHDSRKERRLHCARNFQTLYQNHHLKKLRDFVK